MSVHFVQYEVEEICVPNFDLCIVSRQMSEHMEMLYRAVFLSVVALESLAASLSPVLTHTAESHL